MSEEPDWNEVKQELGLPEQMDLDRLRRAFSHGSYVREQGLPAVESNQRLEFLGDAVLDMALAVELYEKHPDLPEGELTKAKASLVRAEALQKVAEDLGLSRYVLLGRGEIESGGRHKPSIIADCMEALIGAIYLSCGWEAVRGFILRAFAPLLESSCTGELIFDHKSRLQEFLQAHGEPPPDYSSVEVLGPPHDRTFVIEARLDGDRIGLGEGPNKQMAQQRAAAEAMKTREQWYEHE